MLGAAAVGCNSILGFEEGEPSTAVHEGGRGGTGAAAQGGGLPDGQPCASDGECASGYCTRDICCVSRCDQPCHTCDDGRCNLVALGADPHDACVDGVCDGAGDCLSGTTEWAKRFGDSQEQMTLSVAVDGQHNIVMTGWFEGTIDFGDGPLSNAGSKDGFVAKLDQHGTLDWAVPIAGDGLDAAIRVAVDESGDVIVVGQFSQPLTFCGETLAHAGGDDVFVVKLAPTGTCLWAKSFGGAANEVPAFGLAMFPDASMAIAGAFAAPITVETEAGAQQLTSAGGSDAFLIHLDALGNATGAIQYGDDADQSITALDANAAGELVIAGDLNGSVDIGGHVATVGGGATGAFVARIDALGNTVSCSKCTSPSRVIVRDARFGPNDSIVAVGSFVDEIDCGQGPLTGTDDEDAYVVAFGPTGEQLFIKGYGASGRQDARGVTVSRRGHLLITGHTRNTVDFGGGGIAGGGLDDAFLLRLSPEGEHVWSRAWGDSAEQRGRAVAIDSGGHIVLGGYFQAGLTLDEFDLVSVGAFDSFVARLAP